MQSGMSTTAPGAFRLLWVLVGEYAFAVGASLVTGVPLALVVTVAFGLALAVLVETRAATPTTRPLR